MSTLGAQGGRPYRFQVDAIDSKANHWFEWTRFHATKVRNVSKVGSQLVIPCRGPLFPPSFVWFGEFDTRSLWNGGLRVASNSPFFQVALLMMMARSRRCSAGGCVGNQAGKWEHGGCNDDPPATTDSATSQERGDAAAADCPEDCENDSGHSPEHEYDTDSHELAVWRRIERPSPQSHYASRGNWSRASRRRSAEHRFDARSTPASP